MYNCGSLQLLNNPSCDPLYMVFYHLHNNKYFLNMGRLWNIVIASKNNYIYVYQVPIVNNLRIMRLKLTIINDMYSEVPDY